MVKAMEMAQQEFNRAVAADMGIYLIAEAFGIKPIQVVRHGDGYGLLTEKYVVVEIARQIEEMGIAKEEAKPATGVPNRKQSGTMRSVRGKARNHVGDMGNQRGRQTVVCQR